MFLPVKKTIPLEKYPTLKVMLSASAATTGVPFASFSVKNSPPRWKFTVAIVCAISSLFIDSFSDLTSQTTTTNLSFFGSHVKYSRHIRNDDNDADDYQEVRLSQCFVVMPAVWLKPMYDIHKFWARLRGSVLKLLENPKPILYFLCKQLVGFCCKLPWPVMIMMIWHTLSWVSQRSSRFITIYPNVQLNSHCQTSYGCPRSFKGNLTFHLSTSVKYSRNIIVMQRSQMVN